MRVGVDIGGTFTDLAAVTPEGGIVVHKVPSTPGDPALGMWEAIEGIRDTGYGIRRSSGDDVSRIPSPGSPVDTLVHGTTLATNALLERRGARIVLVTTAGFEDLLWLRRQDRASLYDLTKDHPPPLVARERVVGVRERMGPDGPIMRLSSAEVSRVVRRVKALKPEAVAVVFLFAFRHGVHERRVVAALRQALEGVSVAASHEVLPAFREYERASTTTAEAYLRPRLERYVASLTAEAAGRRIGGGGLRIMSSSGGTLAPPQAAQRAAELVLSGPAGGVVGAALVARAAGVTDCLTLDMGGTSADASLIRGGEWSAEGGETVAGVPLALPAILIETVSAGGGSVAWVDDGGALRVGPRSAGAEPGPACYGRGGTEPTVTDAALVLGWLDAEHPLAEAVRLHPAAAERAVAALGRRVGRDARGTAAGIVEVATAAMARALKVVSVARGVDPRHMALLPFGGAGPLFGCALAQALGMRTILIPPHPGVLSALGLAAAAERLDYLASVHERLDGSADGRIAGWYKPLRKRAERELPGATLTRLADCRFAGQGYEVTVPVTSGDPAALDRAFREAHRVRFGHADPTAPIEVVAVRVVATRAVPAPDFRAASIRNPQSTIRSLVVRAQSVDASVLSLDDLPEGLEIRGPAILRGGDATALIEPKWRGVVLASGAIRVERA